MKNFVVVLLGVVSLLASCTSARYGHVPKIKREDAVLQAKQPEKELIETTSLSPKTPALQTLDELPATAITPLSIRKRTRRSSIPRLPRFHTLLLAANPSQNTAKSTTPGDKEPLSRKEEKDGWWVMKVAITTIASIFLLTVFFSIDIALSIKMALVLLLLIGFLVWRTFRLFSNYRLSSLHNAKKLGAPAYNEDRAWQVIDGVLVLLSVAFIVVILALLFSFKIQIGMVSATFIDQVAMNFLWMAIAALIGFVSRKFVARG